MFIDHRGLVHPSGFLPVVAGDVHDRSLVEIYRGDETMRRLRRPASFVVNCGTCEYAEVCGGSRSRADAVTGDPFAADPSCVRNADLVLT